MNLCVYCSNNNKDEDIVCKNCGYELNPNASPIFNYVKLIGQLKNQIADLKKEQYHAYSNWED
jgi:predicted amidophosphoribosyltransferase